jgi:hypothetical protein
VPGGARLSFSEKQSLWTPAKPLEADASSGRSVLLYPQRFSSLKSVRRVDGATADASIYPFDQGHEDLIIMREAAGTAIGWSAALARLEGFLFFALKDASVLPHTVLWLSNGGRIYPPWNGRHRAVVGIEEASLDHRMTISPVDDPTGLRLDGGKTTTLRYALGAIPAPEHWTAVSDIELGNGNIKISDVHGDARVVPFLAGFF